MTPKSSKPKTPDSSAAAFPPLDASFFSQDVVQVARALLGMQLVRETESGLCRGRIVETEAYLAANDPACHAARGPTRRNASMFGPPGRAYVYSIHARWCFNVVTEPENVPSAVLVRALEPLAGVPWMQANRGVEALLDLARGPARLCEALAIDRRLDGWDLGLGRSLWIARDAEFSVESSSIVATPRIGIRLAQELPLRFLLQGNRYVSGRRIR